MQRWGSVRATMLAGALLLGGLALGPGATDAAELRARITTEPGVSRTTQVSVATGQLVAFEAAATGRVMRAAWNFGDGTYLLGGATESHVYRAPGRYVVQVNTVNADQQDEFATIIVVVGGQADSRAGAPGPTAGRRDAIVAGDEDSVSNELLPPAEGGVPDPLGNGGSIPLP